MQNKINKLEKITTIISSLSKNKNISEIWKQTRMFKNRKYLKLMNYT